MKSASAKGRPCPLVLAMALVVCFVFSACPLRAEEDRLPEGMRMLEQSRYVEAVRLFSDMLMENPQRAEVWYLRARALEGLKLWGRAAVDLAQVIALTPSCPGSVFAERGIAQLEKQQFEKALEDFDTALRRGEKTEQVYANRAVALHQLGRLAEADADLGQSLRLSPTVAAYAHRARLCLERGQLERALADAGEAILRSPSDGGLYVLRARILMRLHRLREALGDATLALHFSADDVLALRLRASIHRALGQAGKAGEDELKADQVERRSGVDSARRGDACLQRGDLEGAVREYTQALATNRCLFQALEGRARIRMQMGRPDQALADVEVMVKTKPLVAVGWQMRGHLKRLLLRFQEAVEDCNTALVLEPGVQQCYADRGQAQFRLSRYGSAIGDLTRARRLGGLSPEASYCNVLALFLCGGVLEARAESYEFLSAPSPSPPSPTKAESRGSAPSQSPPSPTKAESRGSAPSQSPPSPTKAESRGSAPSQSPPTSSDRAMRPWFAILATLTERALHCEAEARVRASAALAEDPVSWPAPILAALADRLPVDQAVARAKDESARTQAHAVLGVDEALRGHRERALSLLSWLERHGSKQVVEYELGRAYLRRLAPPKPSHRLEAPRRATWCGLLGCIRWASRRPQGRPTPPPLLWVPHPSPCD